MITAMQVLGHIRPRRTKSLPIFWTIAAVVVALLAASCGGASESDTSAPMAPQFIESEMPFAAAAPAAAPAPAKAMAGAAQADSAISRGAPGLPAAMPSPVPMVAPPPPRPAAPAAPAAAPAPARAPASRFAAPAAPPPPEPGKVATPDLSTEEAVASQSTQQRIIVRTANVTLVVQDVSGSVDRIGEVAQSLGGWVVSTIRNEKHRGSISIRVPAGVLDDAIKQLRDMAVEVKAEEITSRDVTDEFVDIQARLKNLLATEEALVKLLDRAEKVEDALKVQESLQGVREEIERHEGRINFLRQTSAFSLINVNLRLAPSEMVVDGGLDRTVTIGQAVRFRAAFKPPEGIDDFFFTWDFGDDSPRVTGRGTSRATDPDTRFTATITHFYSSEKDSPYFAEIKITGNGEAGLAEGEATLKVEVVKSSEMTVDAGSDQTAGVGSLVRFRAFFDVPEGMESFFFTWDFGDGSRVISSDRTAPTPEENRRVTATVNHAYHDEKDSPFFAIVKLRGSGEDGIAEGEDTIKVTVTRVPTIEVFAGSGITVEEGEEVEVTGSFTRPQGVTDLRYRWDFGDGSAPVEGQIAEGITTAVAKHVYPDFRPFPFEAKLTITADSEAGKAEASSSLQVRVLESKGWVVAGWSAEDQGKTAVRSLSAVGQGILSGAIWLAIFSPIWLIGGFGMVQAWRRLRRRSQPAPQTESTDATSEEA